MNKRHFRSLIDINTNEFLQMIQKSIEFKRLDNLNKIPRMFVNKTLAMIFKKNSTRTRVSFETAMYKLGGHAIFLSEETSQLKRGEDISDTAQVLSGMVDLIITVAWELLASASSTTLSTEDVSKQFVTGS